MPLREAARIVDEDSIRTYQVTMYAFILIAGVWAVCAGEIPNAVSQILGRPAHVGWVGLLIAAPLVTFAGIAIERRRVLGLWLQLAGNGGIAFALATYVLALGRTVYAGRASFAVWVVCGLVACACRLVWRDWRRIRVVARAVRSMDR
ncbi:hypothetical protein [Nocardia abscessus]|uniref:hypothetical protein n=1 Tax=Nocardia abscessus TaxID=120957 RepID=UPI002457B490|nr:hypothetical protein [Nocardia abscessus]